MKQHEHVEHEHAEHAKHVTHHEAEETEQVENVEDCCGLGGCCSDEACRSDVALRVGYILQWVLLGGAFIFSLLTLILLPRIVRSAVTHDQALKAGGEENYEKLTKEIYDTQDYKDMMKSQVDMFIKQNKSTIEMYKKQGDATAQPSAQVKVENGTGTSETSETETGSAK